MTVDSTAERICDVETHIVVTCPATVWRLADGTHCITFDTPYACVDNPFTSSGDVWDESVEDWGTSNDLADRYDLPQSVALEVAIGPRLHLYVA